MSIEEAIDILEEVKTLDDSMYAFNTAYCEALDMAIEALKIQSEAQRDYEAAVEMQEYCERYEPTYNPEDGSM